MVPPKSRRQGRGSFCFNGGGVHNRSPINFAHVPRKKRDEAVELLTHRLDEPRVCIWREAEATGYDEDRV